MWRGEFENRFRGWNGEKRRINNKDSMERGVSNFAEREFTFFFFFFVFPSVRMEEARSKILQSSIQ